jgi:hypothetical protein
MILGGTQLVFWIMSKFCRPANLSLGKANLYAHMIVLTHSFLEAALSERSADRSAQRACVPAANGSVVLSRQRPSLWRLTRMSYWFGPSHTLGAGELAQDVGRRDASERQQSALTNHQPRRARRVQRLLQTASAGEPCEINGERLERGHLVPLPAQRSTRARSSRDWHSRAQSP